MNIMKIRFPIILLLRFGRTMTVIFGSVRFNGGVNIVDPRNYGKPGSVINYQHDVTRRKFSERALGNVIFT